MTLEELLRLAKENIKTGKVHRLHEVACKYRKAYLQVITGEDIKDLLPNFELREDKELYDQRVKLTNQNLTEVSNPIANRFYGVSRVEPIEKRFRAINELKQKYIEQVEGVFYDNKGIENYLANVTDKIGMFDPNAWQVVDFYYDDAGEIFCFPVILSSNIVIDWRYNEKRQALYVMTREVSEIKVPSGLVMKFTDYTVFGKNQIVKFLEKSVEREAPAKYEEIFSEGGRAFYVVVRQINPDLIDVAPAKRLGYLQSESNPELFLSPLHKALQVFHDLIRDKSEYDVSKRSHVFPQKVMYDVLCPGEVHIDPSRRCMGGYIVGTQDKCQVCGGSGYKPHRSGQEVVKFNMPRSKEEMIPIDQLMTYITTDLKAVEMLGNDIRLAAQRAEAAIFSIGSLQKTSGVGVKEVKQTATEISISNDEYNFVLDLWAKNRASLYKFIIQSIGRVFDTDVDVVFVYNGLYVKETIDEMLTRYNTLKTANASAELIEDSEYRIAKAMLESDPESFREYQVRKAFEPFKGMSINQISLALSSEYVPERTKVLYLNFSNVFEKIYQTEGDKFYTLPFAQQEETVNKILDEILAQIGTTRATLIKPTPRQ